MKYSPPLEIEPVQLIGGRLVRRIIFPVETIARDTLELTRSCGPKRGRGGHVTLVLPKELVEEGHQQELDVSPVERLDQLTQRIRAVLKDDAEVDTDEPSTVSTRIGSTYKSLLFGS